MITATLIMAMTAAVLYFLAVRRGDGSHARGVQRGFKLLKSIWPMLIAAFFLSGYIEVTVDSEMTERWLGSESGLLGLILGSFVGGLVPGGPYVSLPILASVYHSGIGLGVAVAFITGWSLWSIGLIPFEIAFLGHRFTLIRSGLALIFPPLAGLAAILLFGG